MEYTFDQLVEIIANEVKKHMEAQKPSSVREEPVSRKAAGSVPDQPVSIPIASQNEAGKTEEELEELKASTSARVGIGCAGPRMKTKEMLKFRADHAAARDAVQSGVDEAFLEKLGLFSVSSICKDNNEYLTRPDHGRILSEESRKLLKERCIQSPQIQIFAGGGLSSVAIQANLETILPILTESLSAKGYKVGTPFYAKYSRVGLEDDIAVTLDAEVICVLIGERPGLMTAESMSAYIAYRATPNMPESRRTVVSNIHKGGTAAAEAGAYVADIIEQIYNAKASGVELKR